MKKPKIAIFVHHPKCSVQSVNGVIKALSDFDFKIFTKHKVEDDFFNDVDLICFPGGLGHSDSFDIILKNHKQSIQEFVKQGKPYLGICMGAYWADKYYFDILKNTRVVQYIKQTGSCTKRPHAKNMEICWEGRRDRMFFYDGCTFQGGIYETVAKYDRTQYPMAIVQENIGLIGCHPEADSFWYDMYPYLRGIKNPTQHYLREFVQRLL